MNKSPGIIYGIHAVRHLLNQHPDRVLDIWILDKKKDARELKEIIGLGRKSRLNIELVTRSTLDRHTEDGVHQGVLAKVRPGQHWQEKDLAEIIGSSDEAPPLLLILDGIQDPHNLGACIRTANATGVCAVIIPRDRSVSITPVVHKVASGAAETTPVITVTNLSRTMRTLKELGIWIVGTDSSAGQLIYDIDLRPPLAIVAGSEGAGMRKNIMKHCDFLVRLPIHGIVESLNLSVSTGVCLYEVWRQRKLA